MHREMPFALDTSRLRLTEFSYADGGFLVELLNSPGWLRYIGDRHVHSAADAAAYLDNGPLKSYRQHGFGLWRVDLKLAGKPIGMCGLLQRPELDGPDIGFAFLPEYHRQGYANEAVSVTISFARDKLRLPDLLAIVQEDNEASINLLKRNGFVFDRKVISGSTREELPLYRLTFGKQRP